MRARVSGRLVLGWSMILVGVGMLVVGLQNFLERQARDTMAVLDGTVSVSPVDYLVPWVMAFVLGAAAIHLLRGSRGQVF